MSCAESSAYFAVYDSFICRFDEISFIEKKNVECLPCSIKVTEAIRKQTEFVNIKKIAWLCNLEVLCITRGVCIVFLTK